VNYFQKIINYFRSRNWSGSVKAIRVCADTGCDDGGDYCENKCPLLKKCKT
jgi:hypothetical protein